MYAPLKFLKNEILPQIYDHIYNANNSNRRVAYGRDNKFIILKHTHTFWTKCFQKSESGSQSKGVAKKLEHTVVVQVAQGKNKGKNAVLTAAYLKPLVLQFSELFEAGTGGKK